MSEDWDPWYETNRPDQPVVPSGSQSGSWSTDEARVLGALMEKALATPQNYPLSLNALTAACNQTTNRDPVTTLSDALVEGVVTACKARGLARLVHPRSGRGVTKYRHVVDEALKIDEAGVALLSVLLLRGPQTIAELRTRTERLHQFADGGEVESELTELTDGDGRPLARRLEREPGHREVRWIQLLCPQQGEQRAHRGTEPTDWADQPTPEPGPAPTSAGDASSVPESPTVAGDLRSEVEELRNELAGLRAEFEAFRAEFG